MDVIYFNPKKGKVVAIIVSLILLILITVRIVLWIIPTIFPVIGEWSFFFIIFGKLWSFDNTLILIAIFCLYEIIDGFMDGIAMNILKISIIFILFNLVLNEGKIAILANVNILQTQIIVDLSFFIITFLIAYVIVILVEILTIKVNKTKPERENIDLEERVEKTSKENQVKSRTKRKWLDRKNERIIFEKDESYILENWTEVSFTKKDSNLRFYIINTFNLFFFGFLYGIILYILYDTTDPGNYLNNFVKGLFFPVFALIFVSFKSPRYYIRGFVVIYLTLLIQFNLLEIELITVEGLFLFSSLIDFSNVLGFNLSFLFSTLTNTQLLEILLYIFGIIMLVEFFLMGLTFWIRHLRRKRSKFKILLTNKYFYIKQKEDFNPWNSLFDLLFLILWPFNPSLWRTIYQKIKYKIKSIQESYKWDYGRISYKNAVKKMRVNNQTSFLIY